MYSASYENNERLEGKAEGQGNDRKKRERKIRSPGRKHPVVKKEEMKKDKYRGKEYEE